jgi:glutamyl-tRNA reductase
MGGPARAGLALGTPSMLFALGLNHRTAPLPVRERVAFQLDRVGQALAGMPRGLASEAAILSTCNRTELYFSADQPAGVSDWLGRYHGIAPASLAGHLYTLPGERAVRHAFRVAAGLDSMVLGEPQILGQMKSAVRVAESAGTLGTLLHKMFQRSFAVAKEVRTSTPLGAASVSMAAAAVKLAARIFPDLRRQNVLFVGAGEMVDLCAAHFAAQRPARLTVANRSADRAQSLAQRFQGEALELRALPGELHHYDIVVSCTASSLPIIGKGMLERALRARRQRPMFLIDLAVPRDIEPEAGELESVFLYSIDDLASLVASNRDARAAAVSQAEAIVDLQVGEFMHWMEARASAPLIRALRERADEMRRGEVERALRRLDKGESPAAALESLSRGLTNKLLHGPSRALNDAAAGERPTLGAAIKRLFLVKPFPADVEHPR